VKVLTIDGYNLTLSNDGGQSSIWFADPEDKPLNVFIGEVTQEGREPEENWSRILNQTGKSGEGAAYWIVKKTDAERSLESFTGRSGKWKKANIDLENAVIWCAKTSWERVPAFIPHETLVKVLTLARKVKAGEAGDI
jgi:hypothetical protein